MLAWKSEHQNISPMCFSELHTFIADHWWDHAQHSIKPHTDTLIFRVNCVNSLFLVFVCLLVWKKSPAEKERSGVSDPLVFPILLNWEHILFIWTPSLVVWPTYCVTHWLYSTVRALTRSDHISFTTFISICPLYFCLCRSDRYSKPIS